MTEKEIFEIIKQDKTPFWSLFALSGYTKRHVGSFSAEGLTNLSENEKIQKSIEALEQRLRLLKNEKHFYIRLKKTAKSNQDGIFEYEFISTLNNSNDSLRGLNIENLGYIPINIYEKEKELYQNLLSGQIETIKKENELRLKEIFNEYEVKRKLDKLQEKEKELKEKEKVYNSKKELLVDSLGTIFERILKNFLGSSNLGQIPEEQEELDEREKIIEKMATELYESDLTTEQLKNIFNNVQKIYQRQSQKNNETGSNQNN